MPLSIVSIQKSAARATIVSQKFGIVEGFEGARLQRAVKCLKTYLRFNAWGLLFTPWMLFPAGSSPAEGIACRPKRLFPQPVRGSTMPVQIGAHAHNFSDPTGLLSDCHRRIEMFLRALERVAAVVDRPSTDETRAALESALRYFREAAPKHT